MTFGVVVFPGSNCDHDLIYVLETLFSKKVKILWHNDTDLQGVDFIFVPGGFSYGDYLRSGAIASCSPIITSIKQFAKKGGGVLGICNGFQILCEAGLLPGVLRHNESQKFVSKNCTLKIGSKNSIATNQMQKDKIYTFPIAHGEGNYYASADTIKFLQDSDQILCYYTDEEGNLTSEANPNGSIQNIAGVINNSRNVIGLMPHPERVCDPLLKNTDGVEFFKSIFSSL